jgi:hypothetical protein
VSPKPPNADVLLAAALSYVRRGYIVVPMDRDERKPATAHGYKDGTGDPAIVREWWRGQYRNHNIGVVTGRKTDGTRFLVWDVDHKNGEKPGRQTHERIIATYGEFPETYTVDSPTGGAHYWFTHTREINSVIKIDGAIDVLGGKIPVMAPPSYLTASGEIIGHYVERHPASLGIGVAEAPAWLLDYIENPANHEKSEKKKARTNTRHPLDTFLANDGDRPGDRYNRETDYLAILLNDGWSIDEDRGGGVYHLTRPGKDGNTSATLGVVAPGVLHVFTTSAAPLQPDGNYNAFEYLAETRYAGDMSAAARELARTHAAHDTRPTRITPPATQLDADTSPTPPTDTAPDIEAGDTTPAPQTDTANPADAGDTSNAARWIMPPNIPAELWQSTDLLAAIRRRAHAHGISADALFAALLVRFAATIDRAWRAPNTADKPASSLNLYVALIGRSGTNKSTVISIARELIPAPDDETIELGIPLGSAEGMIESYITRTKDADGKWEIKQTLRSALFELDEAVALRTLKGREGGGMLLATLNTAWVGGQLGQRNSNGERRRQLDPHTYRACILLALQPGPAIDTLLDEMGVGLPQRFLWASSQDEHIPPRKQRGHQPGQPPAVRLAPPPQPNPDILLGYQTLGIDSDILYDLDDVQTEINAGRIIRDEEDSQSDLARMKLAGVIALMHGNTHIGRLEWDIAGAVVANSRNVVDWITGQHRAEQRIKDDNAINRHARREVAAHNAKTNADRHRMASVLARRVHKHPDGITPGRAWGHLDSSDRKAVIDAGLDREWVIEYAVDKRWIVVDEAGRFHPGEVTP